MSNLSQQFDANDQQKAAAIRNNKTRLTRALKAGGVFMRKVETGRTGFKFYGSGAYHEPIDESQTMVKYYRGMGTSKNPENEQRQTQKIFDVLTRSGFNATMKDGGVHVRH